MNITPLIPDGYNGPIKQLTCRICQHVFYLTQDDYHRLPEVRFCHECSLILLEELQSLQGVNALPPPMAPKEQPVVVPPTRASVQPSPPVRVPPPRTIDRGKMTVEQLLEKQPCSARRGATKKRSLPTNRPSREIRIVLLPIRADAPCLENWAVGKRLCLPMMNSCASIHCPRTPGLAKGGSSRI